MNQDERYQQQYDDILDAVMKNMLISNTDSCFDDIPSEEEIRKSHDFSQEFLQNMEVLLYKNQTLKRKLRHPARIGTAKSIEEPDQSFWEEWKLQHQTVNGSFAEGRSHHKLRPPAKAAIAAVAALVVLIGGIHLSDNGFLRASRTQNMVKHGGESTLLTDMMDGDFELMFRVPAFIPEGYKVLSDYKAEHMRILEYFDGTRTLKITYDILSDSNVFLDDQRHPKKEKSIRLNKKYNAIISFSESPGTYTTLTWQDGLIQYQIYSYEPEKVLIQIAESIMP